MKKKHASFAVVLFTSLGVLAFFSSRADDDFISTDTETVPTVVTVKPARSN